MPADWWPHVQLLADRCEGHPASLEIILVEGSRKSRQFDKKIDFIPDTECSSLSYRKLDFIPVVEVLCHGGLLCHEIMIIVL